MPELPEVETVMRGLEKALKNQRIKSIAAARKNLRIPFPKNLPTLAGRTVSSFTRRAKYILMEVAQDTLIVHLGMSGRMTINPQTPQKHDHMTIDMHDGTRVVFNDPRRFGLVDLCKTDEIEAHRFFKHLGPEPFDRAFTASYLLEKIERKKPAIKIAIMDQRIVVGVGNIYAAEALFIAGIDPRRSAGSIKKPEAEKLVKAIQDVLKKAIKAGGSSLRDYVQADGELGYFQHAWRVYGREGEACKSCKTRVARLTQGGRSTFYCSSCQK